MTNISELTWTCNRLPKDCQDRLGNRRRITGTWFKHDHPTNPKSFEPEQPYLVWISAMTSDMVRPSDFPEAFGISGGDMLCRVDQIIADVLAAQRSLPCAHRRKLSQFVWRWGEPVFFFPCEAVALLGKDKAAQFFEQVLTELTAMRYRTSADYLLEDQHPK